MALMTGFIIWLTQTHLSPNAQKYAILFNSSVAGLQEGSQVRYHGVLVGSVDSIMLDTKNNDNARVSVSISPEIAIKEDTYATLEMKGVTGGTFVQLTGGGPESISLKPRFFGDIPVISSQPSSIDNLLDSASGLLSGENRENISEILASIRILTAELAKASPQVPETLDTIRSATTSINALVDDLKRLTDNANVRTARLAEDIGGATRELAQTSSAIRDLAASVNETIAENRAPVRAFTSQGLPEIHMLATDLRNVSENLNRLILRIEHDPRDFVFGGAHEGVPVEP
ncbi:MAG: hypothetical protein A2018_02205 [Alphaproteobacteria bacterium GWF2_58_20]|nr:MAG: hypothetical protein A2018_02205 [Alphaproteobacteria bacterium GWF2_58_20]